MDKKNEAATPEVTAKITWVNEDPNANKRAAANITIANCFTVHGLSVMNSNKGLFVAMPTKVKQEQGGNKYYEIAHPVTSSMRKLVSDKVISAYNEQLQTQSLEKNQKASEEKPFEIEPGVSETPEESETDEEVDSEVEEPGIVPIMG